MKKYSNKFTAVLMMCLMMVTAVAFTSCDDGTDIDTNQFKGGVHLNAFGPSPVLRGGELRFIGSGLDRINSITLPGAGEITDIQVVSPGEIRIVVPQNAEPGLVVLNYAGGKITTLTELTFLEPIEITGIAPNPVKPGHEITITGEYLNLMKEVCFPFDEMGDSVNVYAEDFVEHTRTTIKVVVPAEARGGVLKLSTAEEVPNVMPFEDEELVVVLPAPETVLDLTDAKPGQEVTVKGTDLDLVTKMQIDDFAPEAEGRAGDAADIEFAYDAEKSAITFVLPDNSHDGVIVFVTASAVKVACANIGMVMPTDVKAAPADGLRGGDEITVTGVNMDQVTDVVFPNVDKAVVPSSLSATELKVAMPAAAQSGDLVLNLKSGKTVAVPIATAKPENIAYNPAPAPAGDELTVTGRNLDLVKTVIFTGGVEVGADKPSATELKVTVPLTAASGVVKFVMTNGETVEGPELTVELPSIAYIVEMPGEDVEIKAGDILKVGIANESLLTGVKVNGDDVQYILNGTFLYINLPATAGPGTTVTLVSGDQSLDYKFDIIPATHVENVIWTGAVDITGWGGMPDLAWGAYDWSQVPAGAKMTIYATPVTDGEWWCLSLRVGDGWNALAGVPGQYDSPADGMLVVELTQEILDDLIARQGLVITGDQCIISKVVVEWENPTETTVWEGTYELAWGPHLYISKENFDGAKAGATLTFYVESASGFQIQLNPADWNSFATVAEWNETVDKVTYTLTADDLDKLRTIEGSKDESPFTGMIIQGSGTTLKKITYEN